MLLKCYILLTAIQVFSCVSVTTDLYPKSKSSKAQRKKNMNPDVISSSHRSSPAPEIGGTDIDKAKTIYENYFPDVIYPTSILDIAEPFYYKANEYDQVLAPFSDDVKLSYKSISSNGNKINSKSITKTMEDDKIRDAAIPISNINKEILTVFNEEQQEIGNSTQSCEVFLNYLNNNDSNLEEENFKSTENKINTTVQEKILEDKLLADPSFDYDSELNFNNNGGIPEEINKNNQTILDKIEELDQIRWTDFENINSDVSTIDENEFLRQISNIKNDSESKISNSDEILSETPIQIKISIEIFKTVSEKQKEIEGNLNILPGEILEHNPSKINKTNSEQRVKANNNNDSSEEIYTFSQIKNKLLNYLNYTNFNNNPASISISSNDNDILLLILQLLDEKLLAGSKLQSFCNKMDDHSHIETVKIYFENHNNTSDIQAEDNEELKDPEGDFFLDFIISLDTLCEMNETEMANSIKDTSITT